MNETTKGDGPRLTGRVTSVSGQPSDAEGAGPLIIVALWGGGVRIMTDSPLRIQLEGVIDHFGGVTIYSLSGEVVTIGSSDGCGGVRLPIRLEQIGPTRTVG